MSIYLTAAALTAILSSTPTCHPADVTPPAGTAQHAFDALTAAFNQRDAESALASMTSDLVLSYAGIDDLTRPRLDEIFRKRLSSETSRTIRTEIDEICESGDLAVFRVTWIVDYRDPDGATKSTRERDVEVWRRDEGRWRLARGVSLPQSATSSSSKGPRQVAAAPSGMTTSPE